MFSKEFLSSLHTWMFKNWFKRKAHIIFSELFPCCKHTFATFSKVNICFLEENVRTQLKTSHTSDITYVICLPTEHQGVHKDSLRNIRALQNRNETGKCWFLRRRKHRSTLKKLSQCAITAPLHCAKNSHWLKKYQSVI